MKLESQVIELPGARTSTVQVRSGARLFVEQRGEAGELVIFLHSVGGDHSSWHSQMARLSDSYECMSYDMRGHALSTYHKIGDQVEDAINIEGFALDTIDLIEHFGFYRAHLVGLSMGGVVALEVFKQRPDVVQSLTLANSWAYDPVAEGRITFMKDQLAEMSLAESSATIVPGLLAEGTPEPVVKRLVGVAGSKDPAVFLASWVSMFHADYRPLLDQIDVPVLLIGGSRDEVTPTDPLLTDIQKRVPLAQLVVIDGASHLSNLDHPEEFTRALRIHLRRAGLPGLQRRRVSPPVELSFQSGTVAHGLMGLLARRDIEYLFSTSGTGCTPVMDALARYKDDSEFNLKAVLAPHENTAIAMAHGYFLASGKPQAVMASGNVGTANVGLGIINAARSRVPVLVLAGKSPWYESEVEGCRTNVVEWGQDTFDQAAYFREFTKWDYELKGAQNLETVVDRAIAVAKSDPAGPVYLTLPKEALCEKVKKVSYNLHPRQQPSLSSAPSADLVETAARLIAESNNPLVITAELGRYHGGPEALARLAGTYGIPVIEHGKRNFFNFPSDHPMHLGFSPSPYVEKADLLIVIESHVPYMPAVSDWKVAPTVIQIGVDPLCQSLPMRSFPVDLSLAGNPAATLRLVKQRLDRMAQDYPVDNDRIKRVSSEHKRLFDKAQNEARADATAGAITKRYLSYCIGQMVDDEVVIFNESNLDPQLVPRRLTASWFENSIAGGLGWSLGAALGAQLASPEQTMLVTVGDGTYMLNTPLSAHYVASAYNLPVLIVVFNDSACSSTKKSYKDTTRDGWATKKNYFPLSDLSLTVKFEKLAESCGGVGMTVDKPAELAGVLEVALKTVRKEKKHVLVNVICQRDA